MITFFVDAPVARAGAASNSAVVRDAVFTRFVIFFFGRRLDSAWAYARCRSTALGRVDRIFFK